MSKSFRLLALAALLGLAAEPALAQVRTVDPNAAMHDPGPSYSPSEPVPVYEADTPPPATSASTAAAGDTRPAPAAATPPSYSSPSYSSQSSAASEATYQDDDIFGAAEGVFGKGAEGLAKVLEKVLREQGRPNAYIEGREAGGAFAVGLRYGSGTMHHKVEGEMPVYWTGPSLGFDFGGNGAKTFVLVYNLYDSGELFNRFPAAEGAAYVIGGFTVSYMRRKDVVLIPIRLGVGWRLGANVGYMKFSKKAEWSPF